MTTKAKKESKAFVTLLVFLALLLGVVLGIALGGLAVWTNKDNTNPTPTTSENVTTNTSNVTTNSSSTMPANTVTNDDAANLSSY